VSLNYRLGPLGWLSLSQYGGVLAEATNLGLQDIISALRWIQENIARFGGDPQKVTVAGHSAGAYSTMGLIAAPAADGLYRRLAAFSGGASRIVPAWWAEELAIKVLAELGIADDPEQLLTADATLLAETLIKVSPRDIGDRHGVDNTTIGVVNDHSQPGAVLTDTPLRVLASGRRRDVDILLSTATNEADWWVINATEKFDPGSIDNLVDELVTKSRIPRSRARKIVAAYDVDGLFSLITSSRFQLHAQHSRIPPRAAMSIYSASAPSKMRQPYTARRCTAL
jgi:para-nitrobenzyl esterase